MVDATAPKVPSKPQRRLVEAFERGDYEMLRDARLTPEEFEAIRRQCIENGLLGEQRVIDYERKRLRRMGRGDLAEKIAWVSRVSVAEGFDIKSFNKDGSLRYIEVKATVGSRKAFEITCNEWKTAEAKGDAYFVYHVRKVRSDRPEIQLVQNPANLEAEGKIVRTPTGWIVTLK